MIARGAHLLAMQRNGVKVLSPRGDFETRVEATNDLDALCDADVIFVGVKAQALPALAPEIASRLGPSASVMFAQNGLPWWYFAADHGSLHGLVLESVDPGGLIVASIPAEVVVGCVVYCSTEIAEPGVIRHVEGTRFAIGELLSVDGRCEQISQAFRAAGLKCPVEDDLREQIWLKLVGNVAFNPVSALTRSTMGELGESNELRILLRQLMDEAVAVATALGISLPVSVDRRFEAAFAVGDHRTSMLQDLDAGKPLEYECMTGAVSEVARRFGVAVPRIDAVHALTKAIDASIQHHVPAGSNELRPGVSSQEAASAPTVVNRQLEHAREVTS